MIRFSSLVTILILTGCAQVCKEDPIASGQVELLELPPFGGCSFATTRRQLVSDDGEWEQFVSECIRVDGLPHELPRINFNTHEVVVMGRDFPCPTAPVVESSTCADGVLSVTMSYETDWCYCDTMSSVPIAVIARKGLITDIDGAWVDRSVCEDTTCDCGGSVGAVSGCQGCPAP